jgi:hypothetical protein
VIGDDLRGLTRTAVLQINLDPSSREGMTRGGVALVCRATVLPRTLPDLVLKTSYSESVP